jgi:RHS repeat-associated protein
MARPVIAGNHWATSAAPRSPAPAPEVPAGTLALAPTCSLLQNWRGDVSLVVTDAARVIEWVQYSAYGVPFGIPGGNASSNGANNVEDLSTLINWINNIVWDARWDLNADGSVTMADYAYYPEKILGRGKLSWVNNRIGYAGYQHAPELAGTKWHVRHRVLMSDLGMWSRTDPAGYVNGLSLYEYARNQPGVYVDPMGLDVWVRCPGACKEFVELASGWVPEAGPRVINTCTGTPEGEQRCLQALNDYVLAEHESCRRTHTQKCTPILLPGIMISCSCHLEQGAATVGCIVIIPGSWDYDLVYPPRNCCRPARGSEFAEYQILGSRRDGLCWRQLPPVPVPTAGAVVVVD